MRFLSIHAQVVLVLTMEPATRVPVHSLVAAFLPSLDRNAKQRSMLATLIPVTMVRHVTASLLVIHALVPLDSLVQTAPLESTTATTSHVIMGELVPMV